MSGALIPLLAPVTSATVFSSGAISALPFVLFAGHSVLPIVPFCRDLRAIGRRTTESRKVNGPELTRQFVLA
jgi:hypothetical protein